MSGNRYGHIKGSLGLSEFSIYGFGVSSTTDGGRHDDRQTTEIDARFVTPTGLSPEAQISVSVTDIYASGRAVMKIGSMVLKPEDAEALAVRIAPKFEAFDDLLAALKEVADSDVSDARDLARTLLDSKDRQLTGAQAERVASLLQLLARNQKVASAAIAKAEGR